MQIRMRSTLRSIALMSCSLVVPQALAGPVAVGSTWEERGGERRYATFVCNEDPGGETSGFARFRYTDPSRPTLLSVITSAVALPGDVVCMAGPLVGMPGSTFFFAVRDNGSGGATPDDVSNIIIAPSPGLTAQAIVDFIGGSIPPEQWNTVSGGEVTVF